MATLKSIAFTMGSSGRKGRINDGTKGGFWGGEIIFDDTIIVDKWNNTFGKIHTTTAHKWNLCKLMQSICKLLKVKNNTFTMLDNSWWNEECVKTI